ncbi:MULTISPECIES: amidohydrolase family protein [unclassified Microbacterium]|uniref:amidohydrolase family protein n=1 Tax=unclassified Microbacterium TaxID=2609290 RepID=UPI00386ACA81
MGQQRTLISGGTVIDVLAGTAASNQDILVEGRRIVAIGEKLHAPDATVIDARGKIVVPGFVDTHRHLWQTALRSSATDVDLMGYLQRVLGRFGSQFSATHVGTATLAGALECVDSGVTTVLDYSHALHTTNHTDAAIDALLDSGARAVFGYGFPMQGERNVDDARRVRRDRLADRDDLVTMILAPVGPSFATTDAVSDDWALADELGVGITFHVSKGPVTTTPVTALREAGLLREGLIFVHGDTLDDSELELIAEAGSFVSSAPAAEAQFHGGAPVIGRLGQAGVTTSLSVDAVTSAPGDMFSTMRAAILGAHVARQSAISPIDALRMATINGATVLGMADRTGSLTAGKEADIVIVDALAPNMLGASMDPIAALVSAAHPGNIDTVMVAGRVLKANGRLLRDDLDALAADIRDVAVATMT